MTSQGMRRDNASDNSKYILIPSGDKLPEIIEPARALRLVQESSDHGDYDALHRVFDRIEDQELASTVRGMTSQGLLIYGSMADAFALSNATQMKDAAPVQEAARSNVVSLSGLSKNFADSVSGSVRKNIASIRSAFGDLAGVAVAPQRHYAPQYAMAA